jgi:hypothetical protein
MLCLSCTVVVDVDVDDGEDDVVVDVHGEDAADVTVDAIADIMLLPKTNEIKSCVSHDNI